MLIKTRFNQTIELDNDTITIDGVTKKIKEQGIGYPYTFKILKTQVNVITREDFEDHIKDDFWNDHFVSTYRRSIERHEAIKNDTLQRI